MTAQAFRVALLVASAAGLAVTSWHFFSRFMARRHRLSVVAGMLPLGWAVAACLAVFPQGLFVRSLVLTTAFLVAAGSALNVVLTRRGERRMKGKAR